MFVVELEKKVYLSDIEGDPGRSTLIKYASIFMSKKEAEKALKSSRKYRQFKKAKIISIHEEGIRRTK